MNFHDFDANNDNIISSTITFSLKQAKYVHIFVVGALLHFSGGYYFRSSNVLKHFAGIYFRKNGQKTRNLPKKCTRENKFL